MLSVKMSYVNTATGVIVNQIGYDETKCTYHPTSTFIPGEWWDETSKKLRTKPQC